MKNFSKRLVLRAEQPRFRVDEKEREDFLLEKRPDSFDLSFETKDGNETRVFGLIDKNQVPPSLLALKYTTNLESEKLAFLDVLVEFSLNKDVRGVESLSVREIENFLRDDNVTPSIPGDAATLYPLFEKFRGTLTEVLDTDTPKPTGAKQSPNINRDYKRSDSYFPFYEKNDYLSLNSNEKTLLIGKIIEDHIRTPLSRDAGGIYPVFADDGMVVIEYEGECRSCSSSLTTTMNFIQKVFQLETENNNLLVMTDS